MSIEGRMITKTFGGFTALRDVSLEVKEGELVALLGPSGSGKTTLLRIIAGLEFPDRGSVHFDGEDATDRSARDRRVGFVFQHYALFRHMSVLENVAFGLRVQPRRRRPAPAVIRERVHELLRLVQLDGLAQRMPSQLSGGQRQRVALARALAVQPRVLLLDEPFGMLDSLTRMELQEVLLALLREERRTVLMVTHDVDEALYLSDRVAMMTAGPAARLGGTLAIPFPRPRERQSVLAHPDYYALREGLIGFLAAHGERGQTEARAQASRGHHKEVAA
jgi:sulfate transport system ATP-binding protein